MCVSVCPIRCCLMLNCPPPTCWVWLWRRPTLSLTHGRWHQAPLPRTPLAWRCRLPQKWVVSWTSDSFIRQACSKLVMVQNLRSVQSDYAHRCHRTEHSFSLNTRQVRCWYSLMGNRSQGVSLRRSAVRKGDPIKTFLSLGTTYCLMHFSWKREETRKMASWLTWRYFTTRLFWWDQALSYHMSKRWAKVILW